MLVEIMFLFIVSASIGAMIIGERYLKLNNISNNAFYGISTIIYIVTRFVSLFVIFFLLNRQGPGDLFTTFYPQALHALSGKIIYLEFDSAFSPGFPYLLGLAIFILNHYLTIILFYIIFDFLTLVISVKFILPLLKINNLRLFLWFYLFCPLGWIFVVYWVQDDIILAFVITLSLILILNKKENETIVLFGLSFVFTKLLSLIFFLPIFTLFSRPIRGIILTGTIIIIAYLPLILIGVDIFYPIKAGTLEPIGTNIWVILGRSGLNLGILPNILVLIVLATLFIFFLPNINLIKSGFFTRIRNFLTNLTPEARIMMFALIFMILAQKSLSFYLEITVVFFILIYFRISQHEMISNTTFKFSKEKILFFFSLFMISLVYYPNDALRYDTIFSITWILNISFVILTTISLIALLYVILTHEAFKIEKLHQ
ncbi:MAG: hypothetical protein HeimC3_25000 [Candidatus Heimdallarchaeota archaeon LC_3]|nr:MAG: hypothetical protein HeimC3_25000 [Candidatus Heimdallarchaeota archaeon LC_3]